MNGSVQPGNIQPVLASGKIRDISRLQDRIYTEVILDTLSFVGWKIADLAREADKNFPDLGITAEKVYEFLERPRDAHAAFVKAIEWTLGINLPPQCYFNAGKRS